MSRLRRRDYRRVPRCPIVTRGYQCVHPYMHTIDTSRFGVRYQPHPVDENNPGYAGWRRRFAKVRVPR